MKVVLLIFLVCIVSSIGRGDIARKFDEWHDIPFSDEKARLDNAALQLRQDRGYIIYLVIYAGKTACVGEAQARGIRAKNHLVRKRHVNPQQVIWIDGGYKDRVTTEVWVWPPKVGRPSVFQELNLKPSEVTLEQKCRIKCRACER